MTYDNNCITIDIHKLSFPSVTHLHIASPARSHQLIPFIQVLPQLENIRTTFLIIDEDIRGPIRKVYLKEESKGSKKPKKNRIPRTIVIMAMVLRFGSRR